MPKQINKETLYSNKEISNFLSNAVIAVKAPARGVIAGTRLRYLNYYTVALIEPLLDHVELTALSADELVAVLVIAAKYVHQIKIQGTMKFEAVKIPEEIL